MQQQKQCRVAEYGLRRHLRASTYKGAGKLTNLTYSALLRNKLKQLRYLDK